MLTLAMTDLSRLYPTLWLKRASVQGCAQESIGFGTRNPEHTP
jgi:hypothetical protein